MDVENCPHCLSHPQFPLYEIAFSLYKLVLLLCVLVTVDFETSFLKPPNNLLCEEADAKEEGKDLSKAVLTFLGMAFLLGFMNDCGEIILELERNLQRSSNTSPLFYKSMFTLHDLSIRLKIQSTISHRNIACTGEGWAHRFLFLEIFGLHRKGISETAVTIP